MKSIELFFFSFMCFKKKIFSCVIGMSKKCSVCRLIWLPVIFHTMSFDLIACHFFSHSYINLPKKWNYRTLFVLFVRLRMNVYMYRLSSSLFLSLFLSFFVSHPSECVRVFWWRQKKPTKKVYDSFILISTKEKKKYHGGSNNRHISTGMIHAVTDRQSDDI